MQNKNKVAGCIKTGLLTVCIILTACDDSGGDSGSESSNTAASVEVSSDINAGDTIQGSISLSSAGFTVVAASGSGKESRNVSITDNSNCEPKLIISPSILNVELNAEAQSFNITAPTENCVHELVLYSGNKKIFSREMNVLSSKVVANVSLLDMNDKETNIARKEDQVKVRISPPNSWEGLSTEQNYNITTNATGVSFEDSTCTFKLHDKSYCDLIANVSDSAAAGHYKMFIKPDNDSVMRLDLNSIDYIIPETMAYVTNSNADAIAKCDVDESSNLGNCIKLTNNPFNHPYGITLNTENTMAFITNAAENNVLHCDYNKKIGLSNCADTNGSGFNFPTDIVLYNSDAYVLNSKGNSITKCNFQLNGKFTKCTTVLDETYLNIPIALEVSNSGQLFIVNEISDNIIHCDIRNDSNLDNCTDAGGDLYDPATITINKSNDKAYVISYADNNIATCVLDQTGNIGQCINNKKLPLREPLNLQLNLAENHLYVSTNEDGLHSCPIANDGSINDCKLISASHNLHKSQSFVLNNSESDILITDSTGSVISYCNIDGNNFLQNCRDYPNIDLSFLAPTDMIMNASGNIAYIASTTMSGIKKCKVLENDKSLNCDKNELIIPLPDNIQLNKQENKLFVTNKMKQEIHVLDLNTQESRDTGDFKFDNIQDFWINKANNIIHVLSKDSTYKCLITGNDNLKFCYEMNDEAQLNSATSMVVNNAETLVYISNRTEPSIEICKMKNAIRTDCTHNDISKVVDKPTDIKLNAQEDRLYIADDTANNRIIVCPINITTNTLNIDNCYENLSLGQAFKGVTHGNSNLILK